MDGDLLTVTGVSSPTAAGGTVMLVSNSVYYAPPVGYTGYDVFELTISDGHCGGTVSGYVNVEVQPNSTPVGTFKIQTMSDGSVNLSFTGYPGQSYRIRYREDLAAPVWHDLVAKTADQFGAFEYNERPSTNPPVRFYRSVSP